MFKKVSKKFIKYLGEGIMQNLVKLILNLLWKFIVKICVRYNIKFMLKILYEEKHVVHPIGFQF